MLSSSHRLRVGHSRYCLILSHRFEQESVQRSCQLSFAGPEGGILSFAILSLSLSLPPPSPPPLPYGADGASIFFSFTFTFTFSFTVTAFIVQLFHIFTDLTLLLTDINTEMMSSQKEKEKKKKTYMYHHVSRSLVPSGCTGWRDWNFTQYIYVLRIVGVYFSLSFLYSIYLIFYKKINVVRTES